MEGLVEKVLYPVGDVLEQEALIVADLAVAVGYEVVADSGSDSDVDSDSCAGLAVQKVPRADD